MCGIFGHVTTRAVDGGEAVAAALRALHHRGPDDAGSFDASSGSTRCRLAHARLSIIDLSHGGHQPMSTMDGRYTLVFNGEIYNYRAIRADLEATGARFRADSDSEVLLEAFARWGSSCLQYLRGMFAFAIWDAKRESLFIARDRLGIKPLYYARQQGGLAFSSEVRALLASGLVARKLSAEALTTYFAFGSVAEPTTIIEGIQMLAPGSFAEYCQGELAERTYWRLTSDALESKTSYEDAVADLRPVLRDAVRLRLIADVPLGIFLSGGIDSSVVTALAAEASASPIQTFTVTFDEDDFNEAAFAAEVATRFGCVHHQVRLSAEEALRDLGAAAAAQDQPSTDGLNTYFVARAARRDGLSVCLSGLGGDELFAGYSRFRSFGHALSLGRATLFASAFAGDFLNSLDAFGKLSNRAQKFVALLTTKGDPRRAYEILRSMFTPTQSGAIMTQAATASNRLPHADGTLPKTDPVNLYSTLELSNYLKNTLLRDTDVMSMAHGLEVRVPLLDHVLVEKVLRLPGKIKLAGDRAGNKPLLTGIAPRLPHFAAQRKKMGFTLPLETWFRGPLKPWLKEILLGESMKRLHFIDFSAVERIWAAFLKGPRFMSYPRVWCLAALATWCATNEVS